MATIQIKRGPQAGVENLVLAAGEMAVALDTGNVYVGTTAGKVWLNPPGGTSDYAVQLQTPREFSVTGDMATVKPVAFNGTANVALNVALAVVSGLAAGTYTKLTVDNKGRVTAGANIAVSDLPDNIPSSKLTGNISALTNDSGYQTAAQVQTAVSSLVNSAPAALDTLKELAAALGNDANFSTTITNQIAEKEPKLSGASAKTAPVDADSVAVLDSAASNTTKKLTFTAIKAYLKSYFDGLYNKYTHPTFTASSSGLYKIVVDVNGHVTGAAPVTKADMTALGIPAQDTSYALPTASAAVLGGVKVGAGLLITSGVLSVGNIDGGTF